VGVTVEPGAGLIAPTNIPRFSSEDHNVPRFTSVDHNIPRFSSEDHKNPPGPPWGPGTHIITYLKEFNLHPTLTQPPNLSSPPFFPLNSNPLADKLSSLDQSDERVNQNGLPTTDRNRRDNQDEPDNQDHGNIVV
jgi:hypothetical protein